jgi:hypothetical protein
MFSAVQCGVIERPALHLLLAEREGFEPSVEFYPYGRLASAYLRPLGHLSESDFLLPRPRRGTRSDAELCNDPPNPVNAMRSHAALLFTFTLFSLFAARPVHACRCMEGSVQDHVHAASAIFEARVLEVSTERSADTDSEVLVAHMQVVQQYKGDAVENLLVRTPSSSAGCGYDFEVGHGYLVYAAAQDGVLATQLCSGTKAIEDAGADLNVLGLGEVPVGPTTDKDKPVEPKHLAPPPQNAGCASCAVGANPGANPTTSTWLFAIMIIAWRASLNRKGRHSGRPQRS